MHYKNKTIPSKSSKEVIGSWIWLSGDTKEINEQLKELNFKWASKKKMWYYGEMRGRNPHQKSMEDIKRKYGYQTVKPKCKSKLTYSN